MAETTLGVRARLSADTAQFQKSMEEARKSTETFQEASNSLTTALTSVGLVASGTAIALITFGVKSFRAAAQVAELDTALQAIGKSSRYSYLELSNAVDSIQDVGITAAASQRAIIKLAQSNVDLNDASKLATVAQNLSVTASVNSADALQSLIFAITTGQTRMLRQIGITTGATEAYDIYARSIGKSTNQLTMAERRQAVLNLILKEGAKVSGAYALAMQSPAKLLKEMSDLTNDLQIAVGNRLYNAFSKIIISVFDLYKKFTKAAQGTGAFSKYLDAMEKVLTKLADPFVKLTTNLGNFIDKLDKSKSSVNEIAGTMEKVLPIAAAFTTFFGIRAGRSLAQAAPFFQGFFQTLAKFNLVFTAFTLAVTSPQIRGAIGQLVTAFAPLLPVLQKLSLVFAEVSALAIGVLAKAIRLVANIVSVSIGFFQKYAGILKVLGGVVLAVAAGYGTWLAITTLQTARLAILNGVMVATKTVTTALTAAQKALNVTMLFNPIPVVIAAIVALLTAFGYLIATNEKAREVFVKVFNTVGQIVITAFAYIIKIVGSVIKIFSFLMKVLGFFAEVNAKIFEFVIDIILTWYQFLLKAIKFVIDAFITFMEAQGILYDVVKTIFNGIIKVVSLVVEGIVRVFAFLIGAVADLVGVFNDLFGGVKNIFLKILTAIGTVGSGIYGVLNKIAEGIGSFLGWAFDKMSAWIRGIANLFSKIPKVGEMVANAINGGLDATRNVVTGFASGMVGLGEKMFDGIIKGTSNMVNGLSTVGNAVEKGLRATEKTLTKFAIKIEEFGGQDNGAKLIGGLVDGAKTASSALGTMIDALGKAVKFDFASKVGNFVDGITNNADKMADYITNLATPILAFANTTDFAGNIADGISGFIGKIQDSLKEGLGFGDILAKEKEKFEESKGSSKVLEDIANDLTGSAETMKTIRQAMADGIQGIKDVLSDLQSAAKDFADSLKDTIVGFAGLKGVELPDGFIPKAKSLIENMQMRLNKSQQFATQIAQLQAYGLDSDALKSIIEEGPIKGAQLATSILGGGADAIAEINKLQQAISYSGALIGQYGADVAFGGKIANAQSTLAGLEAASLSVNRGNGNLFIEQGAVSIVVEASSVGTPEELADLIGKRVNEVFGTLAKELAAK